MRNSTILYLRPTVPCVTIPARNSANTKQHIARTILDRSLLHRHSMERRCTPQEHNKTRPYYARTKRYDTLPQRNITLLDFAFTALRLARVESTLPRLNDTTLNRTIPSQCVTGPHRYLTTSNHTIPIRHYTRSDTASPHLHEVE